MYMHYYLLQVIYVGLMQFLLGPTYRLGRWVCVWPFGLALWRNVLVCVRHWRNGMHFDSAISMCVCTGALCFDNAAAECSLYLRPVVNYVNHYCVMGTCVAVRHFECTMHVAAHIPRHHLRRAETRRMWPERKPNSTRRKARQNPTE